MLYVKLIKYLLVSIERSFYNCYDPTLITSRKFSLSVLYRYIWPVMDGTSLPKLMG